jgi:hypothetical protein
MKWNVEEQRDKDTATLTTASVDRDPVAQLPTMPREGTDVGKISAVETSTSVFDYRNDMSVSVCVCCG